MREEKPQDFATLSVYLKKAPSKAEKKLGHEGRLTMRYSRILALIAALAIAGGWLVHASTASLADSGTLSPANPRIVYTHGPFVVANPSDQLGAPNCSAPQSCDDYNLTINVPATVASQDQVTITYTYDQSLNPAVDFDLWVYNSAGQIIARNTSGVSPSTVTIPATNGNYIVRADPWFPGGESYTGTITLGPKPVTSTGLPPDAATQATGISPRYQAYAAPPTIGGTSAGEPSLGFDKNTGNVMYVAGLQTLKVKFDDTTSPARPTWSDVSALTTSKESLDPILYTDQRTGRTFVSQLTGQDSLTAFSDNDGASWTPSQGGGIPSGVDHQSIGAGPYSASGTPSSSVNGYPDAV